MTSPLQEYFSTLLVQREVNEVVLVQDKARMMLSRQPSLKRLVSSGSISDCKFSTHKDDISPIRPERKPDVDNETHHHQEHEEPEGDGFSVQGVDTVCKVKGLKLKPLNAYKAYNFT